MENNYSFLVLQRYGLANRGQVQAYEELNSLNVNIDFISSVIRLFETENGVSAAEFDKFNLEIIIDYVRKTHQYYLSKKLPEIGQSIELLLQDYHATHPLLALLKDFFTGYEKDFTTHIMVEEKKLLPYINQLIRAKEDKLKLHELFAVTKKYSIEKFMQMHSDTEEDLQHVRNSIMMYEPPKTNRSLYNILLMQLQVFEKDLNVHAFIEDKVLMPKAEALEKHMVSELEIKSLMN